MLWIRIQTSIVFWQCFWPYRHVSSRWPSLNSITSPNPWHNQIRQALKEAEASNAQGISEVEPNIYVRTYMYDMN